MDPSSKTLSNGKPVTKALFRQMLAEEMRVIQTSWANTASAADVLTMLHA